jgi:hypothetical protein
VSPLKILTLRNQPEPWLLAAVVCAVGLNVSSADVWAVATTACLLVTVALYVKGVSIR